MPITNDREYRLMTLPLIVPNKRAGKPPDGNENRADNNPGQSPEPPSKRFESEYYVEGMAATFGAPYLAWEDYDGTKFYETIDSHALDEADVSDVIMQYDHEGKVLARLSNNTLLLEPQTGGLFVAADLGKSAEARALYEEIDARLITKMSWAFVVREDSYDNKTHTRKILKVKKVYDVSAVSIPANDRTNISARSYFDGAIEIEKREALERRLRLLKMRARLLKMGGITQ